MTTNILKTGHLICGLWFLSETFLSCLSETNSNENQVAHQTVLVVQLIYSELPDVDFPEVT